MYHHANDNWPIGQYKYTCIKVFIEVPIYDRLPYTMVSVCRFKRSERISILNKWMFSVVTYDIKDTC